MSQFVEHEVAGQLVEPMRQHVVLNGSHDVCLRDHVGHLDLVIREVVVDDCHLGVLQQAQSASLTPVVTVFQDHGDLEESFLGRRDQHSRSGRSDRQRTENTVLMFIF